MNYAFSSTKLKVLSLTLANFVKDLEQLELFLHLLWSVNWFIHFVKQLVVLFHVHFLVCLEKTCEMSIFSTLCVD